MLAKTCSAQQIQICSTEKRTELAKIWKVEKTQKLAGNWMAVPLLTHWREWVSNKLSTSWSKLALTARLTAATSPCTGNVVPAKGDAAVGTQVLQLVQLVALKTVGTFGGNWVVANYRCSGWDESLFGVTRNCREEGERDIREERKETRWWSTSEKVTFAIFASGDGNWNWLWLACLRRAGKA